MTSVWYTYTLNISHYIQTLRHEAYTIFDRFYRKSDLMARRTNEANSRETIAITYIYLRAILGNDHHHHRISRAKDDVARTNELN